MSKNYFYYPYFASFMVLFYLCLKIFFVSAYTIFIKGMIYFKIKKITHDFYYILNNPRKKNRRRFIISPLLLITYILYISTILYTHRQI